MNNRANLDNINLVPSNYFDYSTESLQFYIAFLISSLSCYISMANTQFSQSARDYSPVWAPSITALATNSLNIFFSKKREDREGYRNLQARNLQDMNSLMQKAEVSFSERNYLVARENFKCCIEIYKSHYNQNSIRDKKLYFDIVYKAALSEFKLNLYEDALSTIKIIVNNQCSVDNKKLAGYVSLINLKAIIHYKYALFMDDKDNESFNLSKAAFKESFSINSTQSDVFLFIMYFENEYNFITKNIPHKAFKPSIDLILPDSLVENYIIELCGTACISGDKKQENIELGLCLLKLHLNNIEPNPSSFLEMINTHYLCIQVYNKLFQKISPKITLHEINENANSQNDQTIIQKTVDKSYLVKNLISDLDNLKSLMVAYKYIKNEISHSCQDIVIKNVTNALTSIKETITNHEYFIVNNTSNNLPLVKQINDILDIKFEREPVNSLKLIDNNPNAKVEYKRSICTIF